MRATLQGLQGVPGIGHHEGMRLISDAERRARIGQRHAIAPGLRATGPEAATRAMTVLHSTEPATVHLSLFARVDGLTHDDVDRALHTDRTLVKQLAMRRTLFVFPRDLLPAAWGSASARVADTEGRRVAQDIERAGVAADGVAWLDEARSAVLALLGETPTGRTALELREAIAHIDVKIDVTAGSTWGAGRVLTHLGATGDLVRGVNTLHWRLSRPRWTRMEDWLDVVPPRLEAREGYAELVRRWLATFGPGAVEDVQWWLGGTKAAVRQALVDLDAVEVALEEGGAGWVLPDDIDEVSAAEPWAALLPVLDPTVMGWKHRGFYLGSHGPALFDRNGNAGTTAWWDGRVVGCWVQDADGVVEVRLLEDCAREARQALDVEAARLTEWLEGRRVSTVYPSPAMKEQR
ncbi:hypothetical protein NPS01_04420 [Nocardioides psychrotolerans]|uniref:Winged helix DNA-binding domain-containing protein n=1 Tax=Nocardioides psychrotolerans TaxID=1005945 RepID=A0A1I3CJC4_9ACTN|nr:winged helix DNA-binding domain-containing protein [Nocardioides psychrotolerans]GEP36779.1 hypothetical protein NPS01_04420 [Nocardioides psychrotolerans]SFH74710.1 Winged helix DNA-binding domain-containing protein [Nocardioides psychrotolerans]